MKLFYILPFVLLIAGCQEKETLSAEIVINKAIEKSCSGNCDSASIAFVFRDRNYRSTRNNGSYTMERIFTDSLGIVRDIITNQNFERFVNDSVVTVADSMAQKYGESINSVHYFAQLPYGLNAPAAKKKLLGETEINGKPYYEIEVTFNEENGGTDFEDEFVYWVQKESFLVDYIAYSYAVDGGGIRFREAYNPRVIKGIRFVDYNNYKPNRLDIPLTELAEMFQNNELKLLSKIETEQVQVTLLP